MAMSQYLTYRPGNVTADTEWRSTPNGVPGRTDDMKSDDRLRCY